MAAILDGVREEEVSDTSVRTLGTVQLALVSGVMLQCLSDPSSAPTATEVLEGVRALAELAR
ncbi:hypothetical protein ACFQ7J_31385 [Streptomyces sp. NPDC056501]|uniref:hypothetical protein n=1 Tax=Streptomyces sp. NPDC056501 TaxID=3345841 RepID=UPI0036B3D995